MVDITLTDGLILAGIGSAISGTYALVRERLNTKHEFNLDIVRSKTASISKLSTDYLLMASALAQFHKLRSKDDDESNRQKFYCMSKFLFYYSKIAYDEGGFELETRQAEQVLTLVVEKIFDVIGVLGFKAFSDMIDLATSDEEGKIMRFNKFRPKINETLFQNFQEKVIHDNTKLESLVNYCEWFEQIMLFEINSLNRLWYKESPSFELKDSLRTYLLTNGYEKYTERLMLSDKSKFKRFQYLLRKKLSSQAK